MTGQSKSRKTKPGKRSIRHNTAANQEKHRADWQPLEPNDIGVVPDRRIMPRDEQSRRSKLEEASAQSIQADIGEAEWRAAAESGGFQLGVVVAMMRKSRSSTKAYSIMARAASTA